MSDRAEHSARISGEEEGSYTFSLCLLQVMGDGRKLFVAKLPQDLQKFCPIKASNTRQPIEL